MDTQQQLALSSNPAYSTVDKDIQQLLLQDKPTCPAAYRSVVSLVVIEKEIINLFTLSTVSGLAVHLRQLMFNTTITPKYQCSDFNQNTDS